MARRSDIPVEERATQYRINKQESEKQIRAERKAEAREHRTEGRMLAFLREFICRKYRTLSDFADASNMTRQGVHWIFTKDDCTLSKAEELVGVMGYKLGLRLEPLDKQEKKKTQKPIPLRPQTAFRFGNVEMQIEGDFDDAVMSRAHNYPLPEYIVNCPEDARMRWLADVILQEDANMGVISDKAEVSYAVIRFAFIKDDIRIRTAGKIAEALNYKMIWSFRKL